MEQSTSGIVATIYTDGGVMGRNPSMLGGSWAWVFVDAAGCFMESRSGVLVPGELDLCGLATVSNNTTELMAVIYALEELPDGWSGKVCSDSNCTLLRLKKPGKPWPNVPRDMQHRAVSAMERLGVIEWQLMNGHPNPTELAAGMGWRGYPVSKWNVEADRLCCEALRGADMAERQVRKAGRA